MNHRAVFVLTTVPSEASVIGKVSSHKSIRKTERSAGCYQAFSGKARSGADSPAQCR